MTEFNQTEELKLETEIEARERFWANFIWLAGDDANVAWFEEHVIPLIALAVHPPKAREVSHNETRAGRHTDTVYTGGRTVQLNRDQFLNFYSGFDPNLEPAA